MSNIKELVQERNRLEEYIKAGAKDLRDKRKRKKTIDDILAKYMESNRLPGLKCTFENSKKNAIIAKQTTKRAYVKKDVRIQQCKQLLAANGIPPSAQEGLLNQLLETSKGPVIKKMVIESKKLK